MENIPVKQVDMIMKVLPFHQILPLQPSLRNSSYTIVILISITERRSVALTCSGFKSDSVSFFFHKSPKQV